MKKLREEYFWRHKMTVVFSFLISLVLMIDFFVQGNVLNGVIYTTCTIVFGIYTAMEFNLIKSNTKLIDLSEYSFDGQLVYHDFGLTYERFKELNRMFDDYLKAGPVKIKTHEEAKKFAIEKLLSPNEYFYLINRASMIVGEYKGVPDNNFKRKGEKDQQLNQLSSKLQELKKKLIDDIKNQEDRNKRDEDKDESDSKYGFL